MTYLAKSKTNAVKVSVTLPPELVAYADAYQHSHSLASRSEVVAQALRALREAELAAGYAELGWAQLAGECDYPSDVPDGLDIEDSNVWR
jgi:Arc/MetJ-type ribon-helix-helix transcriptional regulator